MPNGMNGFPNKLDGDIYDPDLGSPLGFVPGYHSGGDIVKSVRPKNLMLAVNELPMSPSEGGTAVFYSNGDFAEMK